MPKTDIVKIHDDLQKEITNREVEVAAARAIMEEAVKAYDLVNNELQALKRGRNQLLVEPRVSAAVTERESKK